MDTMGRLSIFFALVGTASAHFNLTKFMEDDAVDVLEMCAAIAPDPYSNLCTFAAKLLKYAVSGTIPLISYIASRSGLRGTGLSSIWRSFLAILLVLAAIGSIFMFEKVDEALLVAQSTLDILFVVALPWACLIPLLAGENLVNQASLALFFYSCIAFAVSFLSGELHKMMFKTMSLLKFTVFTAYVAIAVKVCFASGLHYHGIALIVQGMHCFIYAALLRPTYVTGGFTPTSRLVVLVMRIQCQASMGMLFEMFNPFELSNAISFATNCPVEQPSRQGMHTLLKDLQGRTNTLDAETSDTESFLDSEDSDNPGLFDRMYFRTCAGVNKRGMPCGSRAAGDSYYCSVHRKRIHETDTCIRF